MTLLRLLLPAWLRAFLLTNLGGLLLLGLVAATESADDPPAVLLGRLRQEVPHTWALLSPALALAAAAIAVHGLRSRGELLATATLGVSRRRVLLSVAWVAAPVAALAAAVGAGTDPGVAVARAPGAWLLGGRVLLDPGAQMPDAAALAAVAWGSPLDWPGTGLLVLAGALLGGALGVASGGRAVLVAAAAWVVADLTRRGMEPAAGAVVLVAAGLFAGAAIWREGRW